MILTIINLAIFRVYLCKKKDTHIFVTRLHSRYSTVKQLIHSCHKELGLSEDQMAVRNDRLFYRESEVEPWQHLGEDDIYCGFLKQKIGVGKQDLRIRLKAAEKKTFSSYKNLNEVMNLYGYADFESIPTFALGQLHIEDKNAHITVCVETLKARLGSFGARFENEAISREFISPVLVAAVLLVPKTRIRAEISVATKVNKGRYDYSIYRDKELICICEAKEEKINAGYAMNIMQCQSALDENRRKRKRDDDFDFVYGIVATAERWYYTMVVSGKRLCVGDTNDTLPLTKKALTDDATLYKAVRKTVGKIAWMLQDRSVEPAAKRQRVEMDAREVSVEEWKPGIVQEATDKRVPEKRKAEEATDMGDTIVVKELTGAVQQTTDIKDTGVEDTTEAQPTTDVPQTTTTARKVQKRTAKITTTMRGRSTTDEPRRSGRTRR